MWELLSVNEQHPGPVQAVLFGRFKAIQLSEVAVPCQCGLIVQHLLFQLQTPLCQPGYAFVRELELLLKVGSAAAGRSKGLGGIVVHNGILLLLL